MHVIATDLKEQQMALGAMLDGYDCPAILVSVDYEILAINKHYEQAFGHLEVNRQHRCFEVSHGYTVACDQAGESCPLIAAKKTKERVSLRSLYRKLESIDSASDTH